MGFKSLLQKIGLRKVESKDSSDNTTQSKPLPYEYIKLLKFNQEFTDLLCSNEFIARRNYLDLVRSYTAVYQYFDVLMSSDSLTAYVKRNRLNTFEIQKFIESYNDIKNVAKGSLKVKCHNDKFVTQKLTEEKVYLDNILKTCDPAILLDDEQREVILSNEDYTLVVAGAGAGKTTTVAAKVNYLVERKGIDPKKILIISFTNKAVEELRERINGNLQIDCPITTFHSAGYAIVNKSNVERKRIVTQGFLYNVVNKYLKSKVLRDEDMTKQLILFFGSYFTAPYEGESLNDYFRFIANADLSTLRSKVDEYATQVTDRRTQRTQTINNETVRSFEEVQIANFLYMNNIEYEYEPMYKYHIMDSNKPYTPDFIIRQGDKSSYIEHFGISESGENSRYTQQTLELYKSRINDKIKLHRRHKTNLIYTFSLYNDGRSFLEHLSEQLFQAGFTLSERPAKEVYQKIIDTEENKYITRLSVLISNFIGNFKTQGHQFEKFKEFKQATKNVRTKLFLDICSICYLEYQKQLEETHKVDFEDLINESTKLISQRQITREKLNFEYVIIDEYQDISRQRYNLIKELSQMCDAKIVAVGDDWQSIYAFSGSILPLFTKFCEEFGYGQELYITRTYRNAQEVINIAGTFIQKNSSQIQKQLISPKRITNPVVIHTYSEEKSKDKRDGGRYAKLGEAVNRAIEEIIEFNKSESKRNIVSILLIGRYGFDARNLCYSQGNFTFDERTGAVYSSRHSKDIKLQFLTAHSSKGLSAENVIIINAKDETYGFPSKVDDDPVLNLVVTNDTSYNYAEERRLFYVALTRTKNRVFIVTPEKRPSEFIKELLRENNNYPNVTLRGEIKSNLNESDTVVKNACPICGYPMRLRWNKNYGLPLWICSNDQEVCGFMTNNLKGGELSVNKCDHCKDGFLIVKQGSKSMFLGCTNYKPDGSGCSRMLNLNAYLQWRNQEFGAEDISQSKPAYATTSSQPIDLPKITVQKIPTIRKNSEINTTNFRSQRIKRETFNVVTDSFQQEITDTELLVKLKEERTRLAKIHNMPLYIIAHNSTLVDIATTKPTTKQEYLSIKNIGEKSYEAYGRNFIAVVMEYIK